MQVSFTALSLVFSLASNSYKISVKLCFRCAFQVKNKQHSKYLADDIQIFLPRVTMVLEKQIQNKPMAKGDTSALAIFTRSKFH